MTLAVILFVSFFWAPARSVAAWNQSTAQSAPPSATQTQDSSAPAQNSPTTPKSTSSPTPQTPSTQKPAAAPQHHKKKRTSSNCIPASKAATAPAGSGSGSTSSQAAPPDAAATGATPPPQPASAPTICPPRKVIVRQGGTSEPSIELAGGAVGDQAAQQRQTATQMLGYTEANLKKIAGRTLTTNQQDMVKQIHQFMDQSKTAVAAGDLERGRTLAWKAQLLSEELVSPQK